MIFKKKLKKRQNLQFFEEINVSTESWVMCYPYGAYNDTTLSSLKKYDASVGITTDARVANLKGDNPFELPRLDTNNFPQQVMSEWYDNQKKPGSNFRKLLQERIEKANPRREITVDKERPQNRHD